VPGGALWAVVHGAEGAGTSASLALSSTLYARLARVFIYVLPSVLVVLDGGVWELVRSAEGAGITALLQFHAPHRRGVVTLIGSVAQRKDWIHG
jgi:hypothetical protein